MPVRTQRRRPSPKESTPVPAGRVRRVPKGGEAKKRARRKDPLWARLVLVMGALLMMTSGVALVGAEVVFNEVSESIDQRDLLGSAKKSGAEGGNNLDGPIDMLLLGVDARERWAADNVRADTIIILHIPATHDQAYLLSIPRDTEVQIPSFKKSGYPGGVDKATEAFFYGAQNGAGWAGGAQLLALTLEKMTGISFDGAAIINFAGFKKIIDMLGSVRICVDEEVESIHMTLVDGKPMWNADARKASGKKQPVVHKKGCREMEGWEALDYSRQRYGLSNGDYGRQQNQQKLIKAMAKKAMDSGVATDLFKLKELLDVAGEALILDTGGVELTQFVFTLRGIAANDLVMLRTNGGTFHARQVGDESREVLDETSKAMFKAVKDDQLAEFIIDNPSVLAPTPAN